MEHIEKPKERRKNEIKKKKKKNYNKFNKDLCRPNDKVYYSEHKERFVQPKNKKTITPEVEKDMCSICCENKSVKELFTVHCKGKRVGSFKKNSDKVICNDCRSRVDTCPYCRSHALKCVKYKSSRKKRVTGTSLEERYRKEKNRELLDSVGAFEWTRRSRKKMYPNQYFGYIMVKLKLQ